MTLLEAIAPPHAAIHASLAGQADTPLKRLNDSLAAATADLQRDLRATKRASHLAKYIVLSAAGEEHALLFPTALQHSEMLPTMPGARAVSAGFYMIFGNGTVMVGGASQSLRIMSRPEDAAIIRRLISTRP